MTSVSIIYGEFDKGYDLVKAKLSAVRSEEFSKQYWDERFESEFKHVTENVTNNMSRTDLSINDIHKIIAKLEELYL